MSHDTNCVHIMSSKNNKVLYTGVTSNLMQRVAQHRKGEGGYFTTKYKLCKLVYFECGGNINTAIYREKQIKVGSRDDKEKLICSINPDWQDLAEDWY